MKVYRLEFEQPDGRWTGPYCAEWMTQRAFEIREELIAAHIEGDLDRPWPPERIFADNPGTDRYVCGTSTGLALRDWFGRWFSLLVVEGGHVAIYDVPLEAVALMDGKQIVYMQRQGTLFGRYGRPAQSLQLVQRIHPSKVPVDE
jgi:hypothetical protein